MLSRSAPTYVGGTQGRNGQSPNIFGTFTAISVYSGGQLVQEVTYAQDVTYTFGCTISKTTYNRDGSVKNVTIPPGLQVTGRTYLQPAAITRTATETFSNPDVRVETLSEAVICNSPTKNPGVWRNQNGYTGLCSTALFNSLSQIAIHSNSLPPLEPVEAPEEFSTENSPEDNGPATVEDESEPEEDVIS